MRIDKCLREYASRRILCPVSVLLPGPIAPAGPPGPQAFRTMLQKLAMWANGLDPVSATPAN